MTSILPVIMCGGSGTRLWPASRETMPKQFIPLVGDLSTFQLTAQRFAGDKRFLKPVILTSEDFRFVVAEQLRQLGIEATIMLEPERRDSAAAVAVAALLGHKLDPHTVVGVFAADHLIENVAAFRASCGEAATAAATGRIMTLGIVPTSPATGYGYIKPGAEIAGTAARSVAAFVEKPNATVAADYVSKGYLWNSGNFLFRADTMLAELSAHAPLVLAAATAAVDKAVASWDFTRLDAPAFAQAPKISIDFAVMEHTKQAGVVSAAFDWSDVGSWGAVWDVSPRDAQGNAVRGEVELVDASNNLVFSDEMLTAVVGIDNAVVVATRDAVLVTTRERAEGVKALVAQLTKNGRSEVRDHLRMHRPWGWYQRVDIGTRFQVKRIMVSPGARLSLQKHFHRAEHWIVVHGTAEVTRDTEVFQVHENESTYLPIGCVHRLANPGKIPLEIIEVQVGSYTGEDDIIRLDDVYQRS
jgi:mannose-1-phosphate guanylyltransferase / mannose-6-phosphate isomerase